MSETIMLGEGRLCWGADERRTDRYGAVVLEELGGYWTPDPAVAGRHGTLVAHVLEVRDSDHPGDIFRSLGPERPEVGEQIVLGTGTAFVESAWREVQAVGLRPDDDRDTDWLDPEKLYRAQNQTVRLELHIGS
jgi:hypothetical protein